MAGVRVRFAPSPTGYLHVGGARTALFNWLFARNTGGKFILRIEDTDMERSTEGSYKAIVEDLKWLGLEWDEGPLVGGEYSPYFQSERRHFYRQWGEKLLKEGKAYHCFCTPGDLERMREELKRQGRDIKYDRRCRDLGEQEVRRRIEKGEPSAIRFKSPLAGETVVEDFIKGTITFENTTIDDFVIMKSDGYPTYNFACVVDDMMMKISHVIRGDDHLSNTPKQILIYHALGATPPIFAHVPMIMGPDRSRLSKRHGATSIGQFRKDGYLPETMVNYLALLGWSYDDSTTIFSKDELVEKFSLSKVSSTPAVFDYAKLQWLNCEYMKRKSSEEKVDLVLSHLKGAGLVSEVDQSMRDYIRRVVEVLGERLRIAKQVTELASYFFVENLDYDQEIVSQMVSQHHVVPILKFLEDRLSKIEDFSSISIESVMRGLVAEMGVKASEVYQPARFAVTGLKHSPDLARVMEIIGKERVLVRLRDLRHRLIDI
ncbi:MAG: glutamate--tRNA ligase [bacterium]